MYVFSKGQFLFVAFLFLQAVSLQPAFSADKPVSSKKQSTAGLYVTATEAHAMKKKLGDKLLLIDVRTREELIFVGAPSNLDQNIPIISLNYKRWDEKKGSFKQVLNPRFVPQVNELIEAKELTKNAPIILLCRSGSRSAKAASLLSARGYSKIYTVVDGFEGDKAKLGKNKGKRSVNGWKNAGLPWNYKLNSKLISPDK